MKYNKAKRFFFLILTLISIANFSVSADEAISQDEKYECYTYWTDTSSKGSRKAVEMKPLYKTLKTINSSEIGGYNLSALSDIYSRNGYTYLLDSAAPIILVLDEDYNFIYSITSLIDKDGASVSFAGSTGIYVTSNEDIYICGTESKCVWVTDKHGVIKNKLVLPDSEIIPENYSFSPIKVTVDSRGYSYVLCEGSYYGALMYSPEGEFISFYGANQVIATAKQVISRIWDKLFMNDVKKSASIRSLPYQFTDLDVGRDDFIYTVTGATRSGENGLLKILNPGGRDVVDSTLNNYGDIDAVKTGENKWVLQDLSELAADGDFVYILDRGHGKIFLYDINGNLLGVFGGGFAKGTQKGISYVPMAIALNGSDVVICDKTNKSVTVYGITEYGSMVKQAQSLTLHSKYIQSKEIWQEVLKQDQNSQLAYRGLAKAAFREGNNKEAMHLAKIGADRSTYAEAFKNARGEFVRKNFFYLFPLVILLICGIFMLSVIRRKRNIKKPKNENICNIFEAMVHPFTVFGKVKEKGNGSVVVGTVVIAVFYITSILKSIESGFIYNYYDSSTFNSLFVLLKTVGVFVLWVITNWAVSTLFGGTGRIKEIYIITTYSIVPLIISNLLYVLFTNIMLPAEAGFLSMMVIAFWFYTIFMMVAGLIKIHDFSFGRLVITSLLTVIGIAIELFLLFLVGLLIQQAFGFIVTLFYEMIYR